MKMMINLLPPEEKKIVAEEKNEKIVIILWLSFLFFLVCAALAFLALNFYLGGQVDYQKIIFQESQIKSSQQETSVLQKKFSLLDDLSEKAASFYRQKIYIANSIESISKILPSGAYLTDISANLIYTKDDSIIKINLSGFAPDRENLFKFREALNKEKIIKNVNFPPVDWVNPLNINFSVSFEMSNQVNNYE